MGKLFTYLFAFWQKLPKLMQWFIIADIGLAILVCPMMVVYYTLKDGSLQNKLGLVPTKQDLDEAAETITNDLTATQVYGIANLRDSLAVVDSTMRADYLEPGVAILQDLVHRIGKVEANQGEARSSLSRIDDKSAEQLRQLKVIAEADDTQVDFESLLQDMEQRMNDRLDDKLQQLQLPAKRTNKKTF